MANAYTEKDKWEDDWFLKLSPKMKCVWFYLCDTVKGCGERKISLTKFSNDIGSEISREEFDACFSGRVIWLDEDTVWVPGTLSRMYPTLSLRVPAHKNIANKVLRLTEGIQLPERGLKARKRFEEFLFELSQSDPGQAPVGPQPGPDPKEKEEKRKEKIEIRKEKIESINTNTAFFEKSFDRKKLPLVAELWNEHCGSLPKMVGTTRSWNKLADALLADYSGEEITTAITKVASSKFLTGQNKAKWRASFSWFIQEDNIAKVLAGNYDEQSSVDAMIEEMRKIMGEEKAS